MKKLILLTAILITGFASAQFQITDKSSDWVKFGKVDAAEILKNDPLIKIRFVDMQSKYMSVDPLSAFKSQGQRNADNIEKAIIKGNKGIKDGFNEFIFKSETNTLDDIYKIIENHFNDKKKEEITLTFPEGNLYLNFDASTGFYAAAFGVDGSNGKIYSAPMLKGQVKKLFNK